MSKRRRFGDDTRGIEGLPVRLVIALVVGVASLSVMMNMISGLLSRHCRDINTPYRPALRAYLNRAQTAAGTPSPLLDSIHDIPRNNRRMSHRV